MTYAVSRRAHRPLGARYTGPVPLGASNPLEALEERFERVVSRQSDRVLDNVGDRFSLYLDSTPGQKLMDKVGDKVEKRLTESAYKYKFEIATAAISLVAMTVVGVSLGAKVGNRGIQIASAVALVTALPLIFSSGAESAEDRKAREDADRARRRA